MKNNNNPNSQKLNSSTSQCPDFAKIIGEISPNNSIFEQIVECFSKNLSSFAAYYCKNETLGKDAFQDAMLTAFTKLDTYRGDSPIEPWLRKIVVSSCSRLRRGKKNSPSTNITLEHEEKSLAYTDPSKNQEMQLMMLQGLEQIKTEIGTLQEPNRSLLLAHDMEEISIKELSAKYEMTQEAIKSRLKRARATVRDRISKKLR